MRPLTPTLERFIRPEVLQMTPYTPIKPFHILSRELGIPADQLVKLDANENPYGMSPRALAAVQALGATIPVYPDPASVDLRGALATQLGVALESVVVGSGADELIELLFRLCVEPEDRILNCPPTFSMYSFFNAIIGAREVVVERDAGFGLDLAAIEAAALDHAPKVIFVAAPNNPDASDLPAGALERLLRLDALVVLDEAYREYATRPDFPDALPTLRQGRANVIMLRTFAKLHGLAGLRIGYAFGHPDVIAYLDRTRNPFNVNALAQVAARAALEDEDHIRATLAHARESRAYFERELAALGLEAAPSETNFICINVGDDAAVADGLHERGFTVTALTNW
ncbi:MAG: aminotransferase class I/II-fold pyridoxal phosphate-dependent enzyme, partial [Anaerolineae bacterium]|nr:aminotransferase class I/II-fold pyridoxal phosphate-dependent enzyme [Anaerolineae bacterium]